MALPEASELEPVVVTATSADRLASDAPASISVITREQIKARAVLDLSTRGADHLLPLKC